jgi:hypothetical protein
VNARRTFGGGTRWALLAFGLVSLSVGAFPGPVPLTLALGSTLAGAVLVVASFLGEEGS